MPGGDRWTYANNAKILVAFLSASVGLEALGVISLVTLGEGAATLGLVFLSTSTFLLVFGLVLLLPRFVRRRARSYRFLSEQPLEDVEREVRRALEELGHRVDSVDAPPRRIALVVVPSDVDWWIRIEPLSKRSVAGGPAYRTEIVQVGSRVDRDDRATALRQRLDARLSGALGG